jgi:hypothetical protein
MAHGELTAELLSSVSSVALQSGTKPSKRETKKPAEPKPSNRKPPNRKPSPRGGKPRRAVARNDTSDEDADSDAAPLPIDSFSVSQFCKRKRIQSSIILQIPKADARHLSCRRARPD